ncbi:hypothetical protein EW145_g7123 [Phellinidium pouzarii]|uniref:Amidohydrolase-related domain-containing protein n=1 Tax=Phellinidium pouzarii TaxID=167371 RepID=A0A4S4KNS7_9AGAM|nr:hypothetical protein EW145_g7123 [Phellinidium pouzarii]
MACTLTRTPSGRALSLAGVYVAQGWLCACHRRAAAMKILDPNMPDGTYDWRDNRRVVKEGVRLFIEGTDTLAGSVVTLDTCVRNFVRFTGCTLGEAIRCATYNPAKCMGIENRKGTLRAGADADLVVLNRQGDVLSTWVHGRQVWTRAALSA